MKILDLHKFITFLQRERERRFPHALTLPKLPDFFLLTRYNDQMTSEPAAIPTLSVKDRIAQLQQQQQSKQSPRPRSPSPSSASWSPNSNKTRSTSAHSSITARPDSPTTTTHRSNETLISQLRSPPQLPPRRSETLPTSTSPNDTSPKLPPRPSPNLPPRRNPTLPTSSSSSSFRKPVPIETQSPPPPSTSTYRSLIATKPTLNDPLSTPQVGGSSSNPNPNLVATQSQRGTVTSGVVRGETSDENSRGHRYVPNETDYEKSMRERRERGAVGGGAGEGEKMRRVPTGKPTTIPGDTGRGNGLRSKEDGLDGTIPASTVERYEELFAKCLKCSESRSNGVKAGRGEGGGKETIEGELVRAVWERSRLPLETLKKIWYV